MDSHTSKITGYLKHPYYSCKPYRVCIENTEISAALHGHTGSEPTSCQHWRIVENTETDLGWLTGFNINSMFRAYATSTTSIIKHNISLPPGKQGQYFKSNYEENCINTGSD